MPDTPAFGSADLSNCERELIHLAGSIQPHGVLVVLSETDRTIVRASANAADVLHRPLEDVLGSSLERWGGDAASRVAELVDQTTDSLSAPIRFTIGRAGELRDFEGAIHRVPDAGIVLEFEPIDPGGDSRTRTGLSRQLSRAIEKLSAAPTAAALCDATVTVFRQLAGYDRVMVYRFDQDGHGEVVAEARRTDLEESFLGLHYPATDIPQRARELYLRNRVRVLADVRYTPSPIVPKKAPKNGPELDMSLCYLRSMSPLHLQYLQNMGVTGTLVSSLVRDGRLWGLVACHHYSPKRPPYEIRAACEILSEIVSTRLATLERQAQAQVDQLVRRVERQVIEAVTTTGDWRPALFVSPKALLQLVSATGAALVYDREIMTAGETPASPDLFELAAWINQHHPGQVFATSKLTTLEPRFRHLASLASGVLAVSLSERRSDYLIWFRKEQPLAVTWAGDPRKPMVDDDPLHLSPRRSFAVWTEMVRHSARPWTPIEVGTAGSFRSALGDIVQQIQSVRVLIAQHQLAEVTGRVEQSWEPTLLALGTGRVLVLNQAFHQLICPNEPPPTHLLDIANRFATPTEAHRILTGLLEDRMAWTGELNLVRRDGSLVPVAVRADVVPAETGGVMGFVLLVSDLTAVKQAEQARHQLDEAIEAARHADPAGQLDRATRRQLHEVLDAILANASEAAHVIGSNSLPSLEDIQSLTKRAAELTRQMLSHSANQRRRS